MSESKYVGVPALAEHYGVSEGTVRSWVRRALIPYMRIGKGNIMFNLEEVEREMKKHVKEPKVQEPATPADKDM